MVQELEAHCVGEEHATTLTFENVIKELVRKFQQVEDVDKVWHDTQVLEQKESKSVEIFLQKINKLWGYLCVHLALNYLLEIMKKNRFMVGLKHALHWKVGLKKPTTFDKVVPTTKNKKWKIQRVTQLGMNSLLVKLEVQLLESRVSLVLYLQLHLLCTQYYR